MQHSQHKGRGSLVHLHCHYYNPETCSGTVWKERAAAGMVPLKINTGNNLPSPEMSNAGKWNRCLYCTCCQVWGCFKMMTSARTVMRAWRMQKASQVDIQVQNMNTVTEALMELLNYTFIGSWSHFTRCRWIRNPSNRCLNMLNLTLINTENRIHLFAVH